MKSNHLSNHEPFSDPELEKILEERHKKHYARACVNGKHFARQNRPHLKGDNLSSYIGDTEAGYHEMKALVLQKHEPDSCNAKGKILIDQAESKTKEIEEKKQFNETQLHNLELEMNHEGESLHEIKHSAPQKKFEFLLALIGAVETFFNATALPLLGDSYLVSLFMSVGITAGLYLLARQLGTYLKESIHENKKKILATIGISVLAMGVFYFLATLRAEHLKDQAHFNMSPICYVFLNMLFYVVTVWYYYKNAIPAHEKKQHERLSKLKNQSDALTQEIEELIEKQKAIKDELVQKLNILMQIPKYVGRLMDRIDRWRNESIEAFKSHNLAQRPDRKTPDCFHKSRPQNNNDTININ